MNKRRKARWQTKQVHYALTGFKPGVDVLVDWISSSPRSMVRGRIKRGLRGDGDWPHWKGWTWCVVFEGGITSYYRETDLRVWWTVFTLADTVTYNFLLP